jgi:hypothetical protein
MDAPNAAQAAAAEAAAAQAELELREFQLLQQKLTYNFLKVRQEGRELTEDDESRNRYKFVKPKGGRLRGRFQGVRPPRRGKPRLDKVGGDPGAIGHPVNERIARKAQRRLTRKVGSYGLDLVRTLGWGGNGIASLFQTRQGTIPAHTFVAKCFIEKGRAYTRMMTRERNYQGVSCRSPLSTAVPY